MKCEYCGRNADRDKYGGCYGCGAPLQKFDVPRHTNPRYDYADASCIGYARLTPITRKTIVLG